MSALDPNKLIEEFELLMNRVDGEGGHLSEIERLYRMILDTLEEGQLYVDSLKDGMPKGAMIYSTFVSAEDKLKRAKGILDLLPENTQYEPLFERYKNVNAQCKDMKCTIKGRIGTDFWR